MAPRNNDTNTSYKKKNFPVEDSDVEIKNALPCLLHKKHKVVKLIKSQIQKIHEEGLICATAGIEANELEEEEIYPRGQKALRSRPGSSRVGRLRAEEEDVDMGREQDPGKNICLWALLLLFLAVLFCLILLMVWISSGPLSNSIAHSPMSAGSFIRTDTCSALEKKYLLRWSKPEYFE